MSYARARLWLGICGVGSLVVICTLALVFQLPEKWLINSVNFTWSDLTQIGFLTFLFGCWLAPFDYLGGFRLPKDFRKSFISFRLWFRNYLLAVLGQGVLFIVFASMILVAGQLYGIVGGLSVVAAAMILCFAIRNGLMKLRQCNSEWSNRKLIDALTRVQSWNIFVPQTIIVGHRDGGFTGGIIGFGSKCKIVIPEAWFRAMSTDELATAIARRAVAVNSGSYARGIALAFVWNLAGFTLCASLPGAGITSVTELVTTFCGFTLWSFLGLLTLPTISRNASLQIDLALCQRGTPQEFIWNTAFSLERMQDNEPHRSKLIETIFHPVPSVTSRNRVSIDGSIGAWNVARTTLFLSWACFGMLSRAVHCNVGRPELWTMLPTD